MRRPFRPLPKRVLKMLLELRLTASPRFFRFPVSPEHCPMPPSAASEFRNLQAVFRNGGHAYSVGSLKDLGPIHMINRTLEVTSSESARARNRGALAHLVPRSDTAYWSSRGNQLLR